MERAAAFRERARKVLFEGHERTVRAKRNIVASFAFRGAAVLANIVFVPMLLAYLGPVRYGVWLTVASIIGWFALADIGTGNGLRNRLAEALARGDRELARTAVSSAFALLAGIIGALLLVFFLVEPSLDWARLLNAPGELAGELHLLARTVFPLFLVMLALRLTGTVLIADQKPAGAELLDTAGILTHVAAVAVLMRIVPGSLVKVGLSVGLSYVLVFSLATAVLFTGAYRDIAPSLRRVRARCFRDLAGLGTRFFLLHLSNIVIFSTDNVIIARLFGPARVAPYHIALKYFGVLSMVFTVILAPFWSAFTDAYHRNDREWIRRTMRRLVLVWAGLAIGAGVFLFFSGTAYRVWVGDAVRIPFGLSALMACFTLVSNWNIVFGYFTSGLGKIALQLRIALAAGAANIPLSILLARCFGTGGVILATICCLAPAALLLPLQYRRIMRGDDRGIWGK